MSTTGRFWVRAGGRTFCVEPIHRRDDTLDGDWSKSAPPAAGRGSVAAAESVITEANGFANIVTLAPGESPMAYIEQVLRTRPA